MEKFREKNTYLETENDKTGCHSVLRCIFFFLTCILIVELHLLLIDRCKNSIK